jgi:organic hydroperoxide reductase OsmC/OhrA
MEVTATIEWKKEAREDFSDNRYKRMHTWHFDGGAKIRVSPSPSIVPLPLSDAALMDPEEAFLACISSCHMLFFLSLAAKKNYVVQGYRDSPVGKMGIIEGKKGISLIELYPQISFQGNPLPSTADIEALHNEAHALCFLANSVKTHIIIH